MKTKIISFVIIATTILSLFTACKKDDDTSISKAEIAGKWNVTQFHDGNQWQSIPSGYMWVKLNNDNSYQYKDGTYTGSGTYTISGKVVISDVSGYKTRYNFLEINGNNATVEVKEDDESPYKVKE